MGYKAQFMSEKFLRVDQTENSKGILELVLSKISSKGVS